MPKSKRKQLTGRGAVQKTAVFGAKDGSTNAVTARVVQSIDAPTLQGFIHEQTEPTAQVYTDDVSAYVGMDRPHESVNHSVGEYVRDMAHTNGMESFWAMLKRGYVGTFHQMNPKHLHRCLNEFSGRYNIREASTVDPMVDVSGFGGLNREPPPLSGRA